MRHSNTYSRAEKLKSRSAINNLFLQRKSIAAFPVRAFYSVKNAECGTLRAGFGCSKKYFKHAVKRNLLKRRMREAFRTQKHSLLQWALAEHKQVDLFFLYGDNVAADYTEIQSKIFTILQNLHHQLNTQL